MRRMTQAVAFLRTAVILAGAMTLVACGETSSSSGTGSTPTGTSPPAGSTPPTSPPKSTPDPVAFSATSYSVDQSAGSVTLFVARTGSAALAASVEYATADGTARAGSDYTASSGTLHWAENDSTSKLISVPVSKAAAFSGNRTFAIALSNPSTDAMISNPGAATVTISGAASPTVGTLQFGDATPTVAQSAGAVVLTVNRMDGAVGATSIDYSTVNGTAVAGTDYVAASGTLQWADGDSAAKSFSIPISNAKPFSGTLSFTIQLSNATSGAFIGDPSYATVTISGSSSPSAGKVQLTVASYAVGQNSGNLTVTAQRVGGSYGAASVSYSTGNGTAIAGQDFTAAQGKLSWTDGDTSAKSFLVNVGNAVPFSGTKSFKVVLSGPTGANLGSPGTANVTITGSAAAPPPPAGFWVYYNGVFNWGGDYSYAATPNYNDTSGVPLSGNRDIAVTVTSPYGAFQPYAGGTVPLWNFDATGYTYLTFAFKPTVANQTAQIYFMKVGDIPINIVVDPFNGSYGPKPQPGVWATYKIPLSSLGVANTSIYKFAIQDETGLARNVFYLDNIGFQ